MPQIITNEEGEDVEVYTADEIETQKQEAIEQYKIENPGSAEELVELQEKLREKEEALAKATDKDINFKNLRIQKEVAEKKVEDLLKGFDEKINTVKKEMMEGVMKDHYNDTLKALAGEDEEIKKKIEFQYKRLGDAASTKEEIGNKLRDAWVLATKPEARDALNSTVISSGGVGMLKIKNQGQKLSVDEKSIGNKFGLTEDDYKKYGN